MLLPAMWNPVRHYEMIVDFSASANKYDFCSTGNPLCDLNYWIKMAGFDGLTGVDLVAGNVFGKAAQFKSA